MAGELRPRPNPSRSAGCRPPAEPRQPDTAAGTAGPKAASAGPVRRTQYVFGEGSQRNAAQCARQPGATYRCFRRTGGTCAAPGYDNPVWSREHTLVPRCAWTVLASHGYARRRQGTPVCACRTLAACCVPVWSHNGLQAVKAAIQPVETDGEIAGGEPGGMEPSRRLSEAEAATVPKTVVPDEATETAAATRARVPPGLHKAMRTSTGAMIDTVEVADALARERKERGEFDRGVRHDRRHEPHRRRHSRAARSFAGHTLLVRAAGVSREPSDARRRRSRPGRARRGRKRGARRARVSAPTHRRRREEQWTAPPPGRRRRGPRYVAVSLP